MNIEVTILTKLEHNRLILTGFKMLAKEKKIKLKIVKDYERGKTLPNEAIVEALIDNKTRIAFGTMDGYNFDIKEMEKYLENIDYFFKRSFSKEENMKFSENIRKKIYPLSFNYDVSYFTNPMEYQDNLSFPKKIRELLIKLSLFSHGYRNDVKYYENKTKENDGTILFMCRLWNPDGGEVENKLIREDREQINKTRIEIIRELKMKYPDKFIGGVSDDETSRKLCPDIILDNTLTEKRKYLETMKKASICIASTGLHKSTGWKFAEYVIAGKAIVTEPLHYEVNGNFKKGINYLEYNNKEECIKAVSKLINDEELRKNIEKANLDYYLNHLRPDKQIEDALKIIKRTNE